MLLRPRILLGRKFGSQFLPASYSPAYPLPAPHPRPPEPPLNLPLPSSLLSMAWTITVPPTRLLWPLPQLPNMWSHLIKYDYDQALKNPWGWFFWGGKMTIPNIDKDIEQLELLYIAHGDAKWYSHSGKWVGRGFFYKVKQTLIHDSNPSPGHSPRGHENLCVHNNPRVPTKQRQHLPVT